MLPAIQRAAAGAKRHLQIEVLESLLNVDLERRCRLVRGCCRECIRLANRNSKRRIRNFVW